MIEPQLLDYIRQQTAAGIPKENIAKTLVANGWQVDVINEAFAALSGAPSSTFPSSTTPYAANTGISNQPVSHAAATEAVYGGFWRRLGATLLDMLLLLLVEILLSLILWVGHAGITLSSPIGTGLLVLVCFLVVSIFESSAWQGTPGKKLLGLSITDVSGNRITFLRAIGRNLAKILSELILFIGFIMIAFTERKRGLHDMLAGTLVVKTSETRTGAIFAILAVAVLTPILALVLLGAAVFGIFSTLANNVTLSPTPVVGT